VSKRQFGGEAKGEHGRLVGRGRLFQVKVDGVFEPFAAEFDSSLPAETGGREPEPISETLGREFASSLKVLSRLGWIGFPQGPSDHECRPGGTLPPFRRRPVEQRLPGGDRRVGRTAVPRDGATEVIGEFTRQTFDHLDAPGWNAERLRWPG